MGLIARGQAGLDGAAKDVIEAGGQALAIPADVADHAQLEKAATEIEAQFGPIDVWINVAFTSVFAPFAEITPDEFRRVTEVSYLGYVNGTMVALSRMRPRNAGTIVQVGSALSERAIPLQSAYCGAKHAINGFTESLRCRAHARALRRPNVTVVQMPAVNTPQFSWVLSRLPRHPQPVPPIYQPEVAAHGVVYAADHPRRKQYWVGGSTAATLLAQKVAPAILDRYLARTGFDSQQTDQEVPVGSRPDNLFDPVDGVAGRGLRGARHLRRPLALAELAAVGVASSGADRRARGRGRPGGRSAGPALGGRGLSWLALAGWPAHLAGWPERQAWRRQRLAGHISSLGGPFACSTQGALASVTLVRAGYGVALAGCATGPHQADRGSGDCCAARLGLTGGRGRGGLVRWRGCWGFGIWCRRG